LREFTVGVQVVAPAQQSEFFNSPSEGEAGGEGGGSRGQGAEAGAGAAAVNGGVAPLPSAEFVRFNAAGLQALLAEGCLFGWMLWQAEAEAMAVLAAAPDDGSASARTAEGSSLLLTPPAAP